MASKKLIRQRLQFMLAVESDDRETVSTLLANPKFSPDFSTDTGVLMYDPDEAEDWDEDEWEQLKTWQDEADDWVSLTSPLWESRDNPDLFVLLRPQASMDVFFTKLLVPVCLDDENEFRSQLAFLKQQVGAETVGRFFGETVKSGAVAGYRLEADDGHLHTLTPEKLTKYQQMVSE